MEYNKILNTEYLSNFIKENYNMSNFNMKELIKNILIDLNNFDINKKQDYIKMLEHNIINLDKLYSLCYYYYNNNIINNKYNYNYNEILNIIDNFYDLLYKNNIFYNILLNIELDNNSYIIKKLLKKCKKYNSNNKSLNQLYILKNKNKDKLLELKQKEFKIYLPNQIKEELINTPLNNLIYDNYIYLTIDNYFKLLQLLNPLYNKKIISEFFKFINKYIINYIYFHINNFTYLNKTIDKFNIVNMKQYILYQSLYNKLKKYIKEDYNKLKNYCNFNNINFDNIKFEDICYYVNKIKEYNYKQIKLLDFKDFNEKDLFNNTLQKIIQYLCTIFNFKINKKNINNNFFYLIKNDNINIELFIFFNQDKFKYCPIINNVFIIYLPKLNLDNLLDYILPFAYYIGDIIYTSLNNKYIDNFKYYNLIFNKFCEIVIFKNINLIFSKEFIKIKQYYSSLLAIYYQNILFEALFKCHIYNDNIMNKDIIKFLKDLQNRNNIIDDDKDNLLIKHIIELYNNFYKKNFYILDKYNIFNSILYFDINYHKLINIDIFASTLYKVFESKLNLKKKVDKIYNSSIYDIFNINDINLVFDQCNKPTIDNLIYIYFNDIVINNQILEDKINNEIINEDDNNILLTETAYNVQKVFVIDDKIN